MTARIQVIGYGSLLSLRSARESAPDLRDFRLVTVRNYKRLFNKVSPRWYRRSPDRSDVHAAGFRVASCSARPAPGIALTCTAFSVTEADFLHLFEREHHYRWVSTPCVEADGSETTGRMCAEWTDAEYRRERCATDAEYHERVGRYYEGPIWRDDILPFPPYLSECLDGARARGPAVYENFCDTSFLADATTTIAEYIRTDPGALPPEADRERPPPGKER